MQPRSKTITVSSGFEPVEIGRGEMSAARFSGLGVCAYGSSGEGGAFLLVPRDDRSRISQSLSELAARFPTGKSINIKLVGPESLRKALRAALPSGVFTVTAEADTNGKEVSLLFSPSDAKARIERHEMPAPAPTPVKFKGKRKVLIVDDSNTIRRILRQMFEKDSEFEVVADTGKPMEAESLIEKHKPDLITLDIHMPEMDGITLLRRISSRFTIPVVMISSISKEEGVNILKAFESGAIDYIEKPTFNEIEERTPQILETIRVAVSANMRRKTAPAQAIDAKAAFAIDRPIFIGSSTGGTEALRELLTTLPKEIPPILIVQHIPAVFSAALANRLNSLCAFPVREAVHGETVKAGQVLIAPGGFHMSLRGSNRVCTVSLSSEAAGHRHVPAVDVLFDSAAKIFGANCTGVILTGMGRDGAEGMLKMRKAGAHTIAQDEETCVVFGMPKAAIEIGAAVQTVPLHRIGFELSRSSSKKKVA